MRTVTAILLICIFLLGIAKICEYDVWYHLATARYMLQSREIPKADIFSYSAEGRPWIAASWLAQLVFYAIYRLGGFSLLILFKAALPAFAFFVILLTMQKRGALFPVSILVVILAAAISRPSFAMRPHTLSMVLLAVYAYVFQDFFRNNSRLIWLLLPLQVLWANLHSGCVLGVGLVSIYLISEILEFSHAKLFLKKEVDLEEKGRRIKILFLLCPALVLLSLITPFGWRSSFLGPSTLKEDIFRTYIIELRPIYFSGEFFLFWVFFFVGLVSFILNRKRQLADILIFAIFSYLAISVRRFKPEFLILASPAVAVNVSHSLEWFLTTDSIKEWCEGARRKWTHPILILIVIGFSIYTIRHADERAQFGLGVNENLFPKGAVEFIKRENVTGNMFNTMAFGGYLIWNLYPERKVFIDGRTDVYGPDLLYKEVKYKEPEIWSDLMERFNFDYTIISNMDELRLYPAENLDKLPNWELVYWDDTSLVYLKRTERNKEIIKKYAYNYILSNNPQMAYLDTYLRNPKDREAVIGEFERNLEGNPRCLLSHTSLAYIYTLDNKEEEAIEHLEKAIAITPYNAELYSRLGAIYQRKDMPQLAVAQYQKALSVDPKNVSARVNLGSMYFLKGEYKKALYHYHRALKIEPDNEGIKQNALLATEALVKSKQ